MFTPRADCNFNTSSSYTGPNGSKRSNKKQCGDKNKNKKNSNGNSLPSPGGCPSSSDLEGDGVLISSPDSTPNDNLYRKILQQLMKSAKNHKIKELSMVSDPSQQHEKFNNRVIDLRNVLSTHSRTLDVLDHYSLNVPTFTYNVDQAIKALLASITVGMAKQICW